MYLPKKQEDMRISFSNEKLKFYIGDVRDYKSISSAMTGVDYVFHGFIYLEFY